MQQTVLITGTSRGIGFELVKQYAKNGWEVMACCRNPDTATELQALSSEYSKIQIKSLDVCSPQSISLLAKQLKGMPIDLLINNAGIYSQKEKQSLGNISVEDMMQSFLTNAIAPLKVSEALIDNILLSSYRVIATITSRLGSIARNDEGGNYAYRASKAAVNMIMKSFSIDCRHKDIRVLLLHPGWVKTTMNNFTATLDVEIGVKGLYRVIAEKKEAPGLFYNYDGEEIPW